MHETITLTASGCRSPPSRHAALQLVKRAPRNDVLRLQFKAEAEQKAGVVPAAERAVRRRLAVQSGSVVRLPLEHGLAVSERGLGLPQLEVRQCAVAEGGEAEPLFRRPGRRGAATKQLHRGRVVMRLERRVSLLLHAAARWRHLRRDNVMHDLARPVAELR